MNSEKSENCAICDKTTATGNKFCCEFCQNWYHHECNLPTTATDSIYDVGSCLQCNCNLFPFSICYDLSDSTLRYNYLHPNFRKTFSDIKSRVENYYYDNYDDNVTCKYLECSDFRLKYPDSNSNLSFLHLNVGSLAKHYDNINSFLTNLNFSFKVMGFTETRILETSIPHNLNFSDYSPIINKTEASAGGTALFISSDLNFEERSDLSKICYYKKELESSFCEIKFKHETNIIVGCIYKHPTMKIDNFQFNHFIPLLQTLSKENKNIVLLGDFNINLLNYGLVNSVNMFVDSFQSHFLIPSISLPTRITDSTSSLIDNILFTPTKFKATSGNLLAGISDHLPQFLIFENKISSNTKILYRNWKKFNRDQFTNHFKSINWDQVLDIEKGDAENSFTNFFNSVNALVDQYAPLKSLSKSKIKKSHKPWITKGILTSIHKRDKLLKAYIKERDQTVKTEKHYQYKLYRNQIVKVIRASKINHYKEYFNSNLKSSKMVWKGVAELINSKNIPTNSSTISLNTNGTKLTDPSDVANAFNIHFTTVANKIRETIPNNPNNDLRTNLTNRVADSIYLRPVYNDEVVKIINHLKPKSSGPFSIPTIILKTLLNEIAELLTKIFNLSIETGKFISSLKIAKVVPIFKNKGSANEVNNYRPISLLSNIDKIFEKLIHSRLMEFLDHNGSLFNHQFGFRKKHSTTHALINLTERVRFNIDKGNFACGVFIDLQKAFDTVDHEILLSKLEHYGIRGKCNSWFRSYLFDRRQYVTVHGSNSNQDFIRHGVPQGSVLGPLLFLIYINDLPNAIHNSETNLFADDTCLLSCDSNLQTLEHKVNSDLRLLSHWLIANKISLNATKTEVILFRSRNKRVNFKMKLMLDKYQLPFSSHVKYLGLLIDEHLSWNYHTQFIASKLSKANGILAKLRHFVPLNILITIYYALFHSHLSYAAIVWGQYTRNDSRISILQKKAVRTITSSHFNTHSKPLFLETGIPFLPHFIFKCNILLVHQTLNGLTPLGVTSTLNFSYITHRYQTRAHEIRLLERQKAKTLNFGLNSIKYQSILNWNQLLLHARQDLTPLSNYKINKMISEFFGYI